MCTTDAWCVQNFRSAWLELRASKSQRKFEIFEIDNFCHCFDTSSVWWLVLWIPCSCYFVGYGCIKQPRSSNIHHPTLCESCSCQKFGFRRDISKYQFFGQNRKTRFWNWAPPRVLFSRHFLSFRHLLLAFRRKKMRRGDTCFERKIQDVIVNNDSSCEREI